MPTKTQQKSASTRYEFRVWGQRRGAQDLLARKASRVSSKQFVDCYFLTDDPDWNAKVRNRQLKLKRLVAEKRGFEQWDTSWHDAADSTPEPFDQLFDELRLDRPQRGKSFDLREEVARLKPATADSALFVQKDRTRYRIGSMLAEVTEVKLETTGQTLHSLAIEGSNLAELRKLRKRLGLKRTDNMPVHTAIATAAA